MANTINARQYDGVRGGWWETGTFTVTPGTVSANYELEIASDAAVTCNTGDQVFVQPRNMTAGEVVKGARITAPNTVKVLIRNVTASNINDSTATTYDYQLLHLS